MDEKINRLELYKELYQTELDSKEKVLTRFTTNISIVTILFTGLFFCIKNINDIKDTKYFICFVALVIIAATINLVTLVMLCVLLLGKKYSFIPPVIEIEKKYQEYKKYYDAYPNGDVHLQQKFYQNILDVYTNAASRNFKVNMQSVKQINFINACIIGSVIATMLALSCYIPTFLKEDANVQKMEIMQSKKDNKESIKKVQQPNSSLEGKKDVR